MVCISLQLAGIMFDLCSMPTLCHAFSLSWRICPLPPPGWEWVVAGSGLPRVHAAPRGDSHADEEAPRWGADPGARTSQPGTLPAATPDRTCQQPCQALSHCERPDAPVEGGRP